MKVQGDLVFPAAIDLAGLDRDLRSAESMVDDFATNAAARLQSLPAPHIGLQSGESGGGAASPAAGSSGASAAAIAGAFLPLGGMLARSLADATGPLLATMTDIGRAVSKQLNDQLKFTKLNASIVDTKDLWRHTVGEMEREFKDFNAGLKLKMSKLPRGSVVPPEDLETARQIEAKLASARKGQAAYGNSAAQSLGRAGLLINSPSIFDRRSKPYNPDSGGALSRVTQAILPQSIGGMTALSGATGVASKAARGLGFALTAGLGPIGLVLTGVTALYGVFRHVFVDGTRHASDLNETISKTDVVLGDASGAVKSFADEMASKFGLVKGVTLDTAASFAGLGRSLGHLKGGDLAGFSTRFTKLSADLSSFSNIDLSEASQAISTGLAGNQSDTLRKLGVILDEQTEKSYAYSHGLAAAGAELNQQQKFAARTALITRGLSAVNGDLERTQGGAANQGRKLWGTIENLGTAIGSILLPVVTEGIALLNEFGTWAMRAFTDNAKAVEEWKNSFLDAFDYVIATVHHFPAAFEVARLTILEKLVNIGEYFATLGPNVVRIAEYIGRNWLLLIGDAFDATLTGLKNLWTNFQAIGTAIGEWFADPTQGFHVDWTPLLDGFRATAEKFPDLLKPVLTDMSAEIAAAARPITDEVASRRAARALGGNAAARKLGEVERDAEAARKGPKEKTLGAALELGSKEAYSSVVNAAAPLPKGIDRLAKSGDETAKNTKVMADHLARFNNPPKARNVRPLVIP